MLLSIVAAVAENNVIGNADRLPWHLPDDLRRFKALTMGRPIVMGRRTFASIGRALPGRTNIVVSRQGALQYDGCVMARSLDQALAAAGAAPEAMVIGGAQIYGEILHKTDLIYLTRVHAQVKGDAFFPEIVWDDWIEVESEYHPTDEHHPYAFTFLKLARSYVV